MSKQEPRKGQNVQPRVQKMPNCPKNCLKQAQRTKKESKKVKMVQKRVQKRPKHARDRPQKVQCPKKGPKKAKLFPKLSETGTKSKRGKTVLSPCHVAHRTHLTREGPCLTVPKASCPPRQEHLAMLSLGSASPQCLPPHKRLQK